MSKHDYTKHSNKQERMSRLDRKFEVAPELGEKPVTTPVGPAPVAPTAPVVHEVKEIPVVPAPAPTPVVESAPAISAITGTVVNCGKLNVREAPTVSSAVVCEIPVNSEVAIDTDNSTDEFYKVCTEHGFEGYCMKKYIEVEM